MALNVEHLEGGVAVATFRNAERMNSFDADTLREIRSTMEGLLGDDAVSAVVLTGEGRAFCTGADVAMFQRSIEDGSIREVIMAATAELHPLMVAMHRSSTPVVAAVNGVAAGGGLGLALAADARIGSDQARFAAGYFGIGASPDGGSTWFLPRLIGTQRTRRFFLQNEIIGADEAIRIGLMDECVFGDGLVDRAVESAKQWGSWATHSIGSTKQLLETTLHATLEEQLDLERRLIADAGETDEFAEGVAAFLEKRAPSFRARS